MIGIGSLSRKQMVAAAAALVVITTIVYLPAMRAGFIWDDREMAIDSPIIKSSSGLHDIWLTQKLPEYHPMSYSVFWFEWRCWGDRPAGYHVVNILIHAANVVLLWMVLRKLRIPGSWLAALLFGVHPVAVASAAWIAEIKNTLSMLFYLLALLFYFRSEVSEKDANGGTSSPPAVGGEKGEEPGARTFYYALSLGTFALALLAKISVVVLPAVLLLIAWWRRQRISRGDLARCLPFVLLAMAAGLYGTTVHHRFTLLNDPLPQRLLAGSWAVWFYLWKIVWPVNLTIIYTRWNIVLTSLLTWIPGILFTALLWLCWRNRKGWGRPLLFALGYFVIALGPVLGVFKVVYFDFAQAADHFQYLAMPGVIALVVAGGCQLFVQARSAGIAVATVVAACLSVLTWHNQGNYADMESLWRRNLAQNPRSFQALIYMGSEAEKSQHYEDALKLFTRVQEIKPNALEGHYNLGIVLDDLGRTDEAIVEMKKALAIKPDQADAHILMGWFLDRKGQLDAAADELREAIRITPDDYRAHQNLGNLLVKQGKVDQAIQQYGEALKLNPEDPKVFVALGNAQGRRGDWDAANACFEKALKLKPGDADARSGLEAVQKARGGTNGAPVRQGAVAK